MNIRNAFWALKKALSYSFYVFLPLLWIFLFLYWNNWPLSNWFFLFILFYLFFVILFFYLFYRIISKTHKELIGLSWSVQLNQNKTSFVWISISSLPNTLYREYNDIVFLYSLPTQTKWDFTVNNLYFQTFFQKRDSTIATNKMLLLEYSRKSKQTQENYIHLHQDKRQSTSNSVTWYVSGLVLLVTIVVLLLYIWIRLWQWAFLIQYIVILLKHYSLSPFVVFILLSIIFMLTARFIQKRFDHKNAISLESHEFEKKFDVESSDPILARQIFNPSMINNFFDFQHKHWLLWRTELYIDFRKNKLSFKFDYFKNEKSISEPVIKQYIELIYSMIHEIWLYNTFKMLQIL